MITVECPACKTRYDINEELPPDGRAVRCARCTTVWRALPEMVDAKIEPARPTRETHFGSTDEIWDQGAGKRCAGSPGGRSSYSEWIADIGGASSHEDTAKEELRSQNVASRPLWEIGPHSIYTKWKNWSDRVCWFDRLKRKVKFKKKRADGSAVLTPAQAPAKTNRCRAPTN